ncbi:DMT family transporter [Falsirhodobacter sp. alg1]|uniref:DMT family transporter n=1 Tax=Falsirhodobacter sp. alg1 TaxID=1472418 RepID=UPI0005F04D56|nr:DMT family transporter [Falsirhodobacter sp. alg1]
MPPVSERPLRGITLKTCSVLIFVVMSSLIKVTSDVVPAGEAVFFRSAFAIPVILVWLAMRQELRTGLRANNIMGHVWRGVVGTMAMGCGFSALGYLPLPEVTALAYATPLLTVIFAAMFLGEEVRAFRLTAVGLGLTGVMVILWPRMTIGADGIGNAATLGAMLALIGATFAAMASVFIRKMVAIESTASIVFYFSLTSTVLSLATIPFGWVWPGWEYVGLLIIAGILGGIAQIFLTQAFREADASVIAPFDYASMLFALGIGYFIFDETPTHTMLLGAAIVIGSGCFIIWREQRLGLERTQMRKALSPGMR